MFDVLVIGGGPTGSHIACRLAGAGYKVAVLEQRERLGERVCCAGIVSPECLNSFAIDNGVVLRWVNSARIFSPSGRMIGLRRDEEQACIIDRAKLDVSMAGKAEGAGATYIFSSPVKDIRLGDDRVVAGVARNGAGIEFEARAAVIATGFGSGLLARLGLGRAGDHVIGAQAEVETAGIDEIEVYLGREVAPGFFSWLVPTSKNGALVGLLSRRRAGFYMKRLMSSLEQQGKIVAVGEGPGYRGITLKPPGRTYGERVIVVGDAAGQVKPTTGGGIYFGLLSAEIAAHQLERALADNDLSSGGLAGYEREWKKRLGQEMKICYWARRLYEKLSDSKIERVFDIITNNGIVKALAKADDLSFDWHGRAILRLAGQTAMSEVFNMIKLPAGIRTD